MAIDPRGVKAIFDEAAEMRDGASRGAYLDAACGGDARLRRQVEALLKALDEAGSFLEDSPALDDRALAEAAAPTGDADPTDVGVSYDEALRTKRPSIYKLFRCGP